MNQAEVSVGIQRLAVLYAAKTLNRLDELKKNLDDLANMIGMDPLKVRDVIHCGAVPSLEMIVKTGLALDIIWNLDELKRVDFKAGSRCHDCGLNYKTFPESGFHDLIIPNDIWRRISPTGDLGGLLCANCICARLGRLGIKDVPAAYMSGPLATIDRHTMFALRNAENAWEWVAKKIDEDWNKARGERP